MFQIKFVEKKNELWTRHLGDAMLLHCCEYMNITHAFIMIYFFQKKLFREIYPSTSVKFMKLSPKCRSGCFQFSISCGAIGELGIVIHKNITTDAPIQIAANTRLNIFLTMFSGLNSWFSSRSCIVVLGDFPAYGLGYLSSFRELDALLRNHNHVLVIYKYGWLKWLWRSSSILLVNWCPTWDYWSKDKCKKLSVVAW